MKKQLKKVIPDSQIIEEGRLEDLAEPVGSFILKNCANSLFLEDGAYYHYSHVCVLLKKYADEQIKEKLQQLDSVLEEGAEAIGLLKYCNQILQHWEILPNSPFHDMVKKFLKNQ